MLLEVVKSSEFEETHMKLVPSKNNGWWCWGRNSYTFTSEENNEEELKRKIEYYKKNDTNKMSKPYRR
jgi:hypothetical protein